MGVEEERKSEFQQMRECLVPQGTLPLVRLFLSDNSYFKEEYVTKCVDELEQKCFMIGLGIEVKLTELEKLAVHVLRDSAYIKEK